MLFYFKCDFLSQSSLELDVPFICLQSDLSSSTLLVCQKSKKVFYFGAVSQLLNSKKGFNLILNLIFAVIGDGGSDARH